MRSTNIVILVGNIGQDAKTGLTKTGMVWANCSLATSRKGKDDTYTTTWHRVCAFGRTAEVIAGLKKGDTAYVEGELRENVYKDKDGRDVRSVEVYAHSVMRADRSKANTQAAEDLGFNDSPFDTE